MAGKRGEPAPNRFLHDLARGKAKPPVDGLGVDCPLTIGRPPKEAAPHFAGLRVPELGWFEMLRATLPTALK